jgi:hypothetical protein
LLARGVLPGGAARLYHFLRSLPWLAPAKLPLAIVDWIAALAMRDYVERRFVATPMSESATAARLFDSIRHGVKRYVREGAVSMELQLMGDATPSLRIRLTGRLDRDFFVRGARRLKAFLEHRHSRVALVIEQLQQQRIGDLQRLLRRLARYGDRIDIVVGDALRQRLEIDSSVFNLVLDEPLTGAGR